MQFDWLLARQSKNVIRNSAFEGVFEISVQETSKDLSQYGNLIVLKQEQEAAIGDLSIDTLPLHNPFIKCP